MVVEAPPVVDVQRVRPEIRPLRLNQNRPDAHVGSAVAVGNWDRLVQCRVEDEVAGIVLQVLRRVPHPAGARLVVVGLPQVVEAVVPEHDVVGAQSIRGHEQGTLDQVVLVVALLSAAHAAEDGGVGPVGVRVVADHGASFDVGEVAAGSHEGHRLLGVLRFSEEVVRENAGVVDRKEVGRELALSVQAREVEDRPEHVVGLGPVDLQVRAYKAVVGVDREGELALEPFLIVGLGERDVGGVGLPRGRGLATAAAQEVPQAVLEDPAAERRLVDAVDRVAA